MVKSLSEEAQRIVYALLAEKVFYVKTLAVNVPADYSPYNEACFKVSCK